MIKAVLLDLDNTLLNNPDRQFAKAFLQSLNDHVKIRHNVDDVDMSTAFRAGIQSLNSDYRLANTELMVRWVAQSIQSDVGTVKQTFEDFYNSSYKQLSTLASPVDGSKRLIENLLNQNILVAIATNPIYPETAVLERVHWAGIADYLDQFILITNSDNMHFSKPDPAYYAQVIATLGTEPSDVLMIGDSDRNDMIPARQIGLHSLKITADKSLSDYASMTSNPEWVNTFTTQPPHHDMVIPQFCGNLGALYQLAQSVESTLWDKQYDPDEWSLSQIMCHLRNSEEKVQRARLVRILTEDNPFIVADLPSTGETVNCAGDWFEILNEFDLLRQETIQVLQQCDPSDWLRPARHNVFGMTTLLEMALFTARHDRLHITQMGQSLQKFV